MGVRPLAMGILLLFFTSALAGAVDENEGNQGNALEGSLNQGNANQGNANQGNKGGSGLPIPRFASLRANDVNLRTGPGTRYPIEWVFTHAGMPVEITAEYEMWRRVRDAEGDEGWVHKNALTGKRAAVVTGALRELRDRADQAAPPVAHLEAGAIGQLLSCAKDWCRLRFENSKGYLKKIEFWGAYPDELIQ